MSLAAALSRALGSGDRGGLGAVSAAARSLPVPRFESAAGSVVRQAWRRVEPGNVSGRGGWAGGTGASAGRARSGEVLAVSEQDGIGLSGARMGRSARRVRQRDNVGRVAGGSASCDTRAVWLGTEKRDRLDAWKPTARPMRGWSSSANWRLRPQLGLAEGNGAEPRSPRRRRAPPRASWIASFSDYRPTPSVAASMAICGAATGERTRAVSRCCSIPLFISATVRPTWR